MPSTEPWLPKIKIQKKKRSGLAFTQQAPEAELWDTSAVNAQHLTFCVFWTSTRPPIVMAARWSEPCESPPGLSPVTPERWTGQILLQYIMDFKKQKILVKDWYLFRQNFFSAAERKNTEKLKDVWEANVTNPAQLCHRVVKVGIVIMGQKSDAIFDNDS